MLQKILIGIGVVYFVKRIVWPIVKTNRGNKGHKVKFEKSRSELENQFNFLTQNGYDRPEINKTEDYHRLTYQSKLNQRSYIIEMFASGFRLKVLIKEKGFYAMDLLALCKELNISIPRLNVNTEDDDYFVRSIERISMLLASNIEDVEAYNRFRNVDYYIKLARDLNDNSDKTDSINGKLSYADSNYLMLTCAVLSQRCIVERSTEYAKLGLTICASIPVIETRDLSTPLTFLFFAITQSGGNAQRVFDDIATKEFNRYSDVFKRFAIKDPQTVLPEKVGFDISEAPMAKFFPKYIAKGYGIEEWNEFQ